MRRLRTGGGIGRGFPFTRVLRGGGGKREEKELNFAFISSFSVA